MSPSVTFRVEAQTEFEEAAAWYEQQRDGLGSEFIAEVQAVLNQISAVPGLYAAIYHGVRRAPVRRFPYTILYRVEQDSVLILAVFHTRRDPAVWQARV